jgi:hypothetical protein
MTGNIELERMRKEEVVERFQVLEKNNEIISQYIRKLEKYYPCNRPWKPIRL